MELVVVIAITAILSAIILFAVSQYVNKGKDSNIYGNMAILIPAGEVWYNGNNNGNSNSDSYTDFCNAGQNGNSVIRNVISQVPQNINGDCYANPIDTSNWGTTSTVGNPGGICCNVDSSLGQSWVACVREFTNSANAYCVDSRGIKEEMCNSSCTDALKQCPDPVSQTTCN